MRQIGVKLSVLITGKMPETVRLYCKEGEDELIKVVNLSNGTGLEK